MIWLLAGLHTERFSKNLRQSLRNLSSKNVKTLVVLQNDVKFRSSKNVVTIQSKPGIINYLQTGLDWLRNNTEPGDWFARIDCDDIYTRKYIRELKSVISDDVIWSSIPSPYVKVGNSLVYCEHLDTNSMVGLGGTLAGRIDKSYDFIPPEGTERGSDTTWCKSMSCYKGIARLTVGFALQRHQGHKHVFPVPTDVLIHVWPVTSYLQGGVECIDCTPHKDQPIKPNFQKAASISKFLV